jgi:thiosulfate reductase cytochrome b subunit
MPRLIPKHSLPLRVSHWLNVALLSIMIWSGLLILWAQDPYVFEIGSIAIVLLPEKFFSVLGLDFALAQGMAWHFAFAWFFALNGFFYVGYTIYSGHWRELIPDRRTPIEAFHVVLHDLGLRKEPLPPGKFNAAQKIAYTGIILMGAGSLLSGLAILKPVQFAWLCSLMGGYRWARFIHFALTVGYVVFFIIHISQVIRAGWNNFRAMVTGWEIQQELAHVPTDKQPTV